MMRSLKIFCSLAAVALSGGVIGAIVGAHAPRDEADASFANWRENYVRRVTPILDLSPEQVQRIRPLFDRRRAEVDALARATRVRLQAIREGLQEDLKPVLTAAQWDKFLQIERRRIATARPAPSAPPAGDARPGAVCAELVGHWPLRGDANDRSGCGNHGSAHGESVAAGVFDGRAGFVEVPASASLDFGRNDFTLCAWVFTAPDTGDAPGDILARYDPARRRGFTLGLLASAGGYSSHGEDRRVFFGTDDARLGPWEDCGRPSATSNYISNSLTVFEGALYAAITDAAREEDWCRVFRYRGSGSWEDCGRVGARKARGVGPMIVHRGRLYAATWNYDWTRLGVDPAYEADPCRVYRYAGGTRWEDCGQISECRRLFGLASFRGALYVSAEDGRCYTDAGGGGFRECGRFPNYAHPLGVSDGRLFAGVLNPAGVWAYDGATWTALGNPLGAEERCNQIHELEVFRGALHATTWPDGHVVRLEAGGAWSDCGRLGDALEINALAVYNGKLYGGSIPRAEVYRYDDGATWTSIKRFLEPAGYEFKKPEEWARVTSLTVFEGKLFAGMGSCTSSHLDSPADFRGSVYAVRAGACVSHDRDIGPGWKHIAALRRGRVLEIYVGGVRASSSEALGDGALDVSCGAPLRIGCGEKAHFAGKIREVRAYRRALDGAEIAAIAGEAPPEQ